MRPQPFPTWIPDGQGDWKPPVFDLVFTEQMYNNYKTLINNYGNSI